jgi:hypothetical protein
MPTLEAETLICPRCRTARPLSDYYYNRANFHPSGWQAACAGCLRSRRNARRRADLAGICECSGCDLPIDRNHKCSDHARRFEIGIQL